jgi:parallel beta-helix repeat protein
MAHRRRVRRLSPTAQFECLEGRTLLSGIFTVTDPGDAPTGQTLRAAILAVDVAGGPTTIDFSLPNTNTPNTIQLTGPLPTITSPVTIDGTSQPGWSGTPVVTIDGTNAEAGAIGLTLDAPGVVVKGLAIGKFSGEGILIEGSGGDQVVGSLIGLTDLGEMAAPNVTAGIVINNSPNNSIGGATLGARNFISANTGTGITIEGPASGNLIQGNSFGTHPNGSVGAGNGTDGIWLDGASASIIGNIITGNGSQGGDGILIQDSSGSLVQGNLIGDDTGDTGNQDDGIQLIGESFVTIGGTTSGAGNTISGNGESGIDLSPDANNPQFLATHVLIEGNWIGLKATGQGGAGNGFDGIAIRGAASTTIGGTAAGSGNVIGSSAYNGINVQGASTTGTVIQGNIIGLAANGTDPAPIGTPHLDSAITLGGTIGTLIQGNTLSESSGAGIFIEGGFGSIVQGNLIGTDTSGRLGRGNAGGGIALDATSLTLVGGPTPGERNIIAANKSYGILVYNQDGGGGFGNVIAGNFVGLNATGLAALPNDEGVVISDIPRTTVGLPGAANFIDGNSLDGIEVDGNAATATVIQNNVIGLGFDLSTIVSNNDGIVLSSVPGALVQQNFISGNVLDGVDVNGTDTAGTVIIQNHIGTDGTGTLARPNGFAGVQIDDAAGVTIGGLGANDRNIISGNGFIGIFIDGTNATSNVVEGNWVGLDTNGIKPLANKVYGVLIQAPGVLVGGITPAARNVISGNGSYGVTLNGDARGDVVAGNWIGLDATGLKAAGNGVAGALIDTAAFNLIGGASAAWANVISGNGSAEVQIQVANSVDNVVEGNDLGTDATLFNVASPAPYGILILNAPGNEIGGATPGTGNLIVGHKIAGIDISDPNSFFNVVIGNLIGPGEVVNSPAANGVGILINNASDNTVGGTAAGFANVIRGNGYNPVLVAGVSAKNNNTGGNVIG